MSKRLGYCIPCGEAGRYTEATVVIDGDQMCDTCLRCMQQGAIVKLPEPVPLVSEPVARRGARCLRGCGNMAHRGPCPDVLAAPEPVKPCGRGCGGPSHRGRCRGEVRSPKVPVRARADGEELRSRAMGSGAPPMAIPVKRGEGEKAMDRLRAEVVRIDEVPELEVRRPPMGRIGELWLAFLALNVAESLKVECRDLKHCGITSREMRKKAAAARVALGERRVGAYYYCWKE